MGYGMGVTILACVAASSFRCLMRQLAVSFIKRVELVNLRRAGASRPNDIARNIEISGSET